MNMTKVTSAAGTAMSALLMLSMSPQALAEIRFRYDSLPIPWNFTSINQFESSEIGSQYTPDFSIVFNAPDSWLHPTETTIFDIPTPTVRAWDDNRQFALEQHGDALIRIDQAGNIAAGVLCIRCRRYLHRPAIRWRSRSTRATTFTRPIRWARPARATTSRFIATM